MSGSVSKQGTKFSIDHALRFERISLQNEFIRLEFLPALGGKIVSLRRIESGREFLLQPPERPYRTAHYGDNFADYDTSGFDECFPSVSECQYPGNTDKSYRVPDHGELWSVPWQYQIRDQELLLNASGRVFPYVFRKRVRLEEDTVVLDYEVENNGREPFRYLWSAHPLLAVSPGCRIILPSDVTDLFVNWSSGDRLGKFGDKCSWPVTRDSAGKHTNLAQLGSIDQKIADKLFTPRLHEGYCAVYYPVSDESLTFRFDSSSVRYVGLWICQGGWPSPDRGHFTLALEPCSGRPDSLAEAFARQECEALAPDGKKSWTVRMQVQSGKPRRS